MKQIGSFSLKIIKLKKILTQELILQLHKCYDMPLNTPTHKLTDLTGWDPTNKKIPRYLKITNSRFHKTPVFDSVLTSLL